LSTTDWEKWPIKFKVGLQFTRQELLLASGSFGSLYITITLRRKTHLYISTGWKFGLDFRTSGSTKETPTINSCQPLFSIY
jgi:hypothetical protein